MANKVGGQKKKELQKVKINSIKSIVPRYTKVLVTMDMYSDDELKVDNSVLIDVTKKKRSVKEYQRVIAVGDMVRGLNPGDIVCIDPTNYMVRQYKEDSVKKDLLVNQVVDYRFPIVIIDNIPHMLLEDRDIKYIVKEYE